MRGTVVGGGVVVALTCSACGGPTAPPPPSAAQQGSVAAVAAGGSRCFALAARMDASNLRAVAHIDPAVEPVARRDPCTGDQETAAASEYNGAVWSRRFDSLSPTRFVFPGGDAVWRPAVSHSTVVVCGDGVGPRVVTHAFRVTCDTLG